MRLSNYRFLLMCFLLWSVSCKKAGPDDLVHLSGTWEISEVRFPDGGNRTYTANTTIDYFELGPEAIKGFRKKLHPQIDGSFRTSDDALPMEWSLRDGRLYLRFDGAPEAWEEEVVELSANRLVTRHSNGLVYIYSRYEPLKIENHAPTR